MTDSNDPVRPEATSSGRPASKHGADEPSDDDRSPRSERSNQGHLQNVEDGCGCAEVWEHLSEQRERNRKEQAAPATGEN